MGMFDDIVKGVSANVKIGGYPFYAENIDGPEPFNRRDYTFKPLLNGTLQAKRGKYIQRKYSFHTTVYHKSGPNEHDKILKKLSSGPVRVASSAMGDPFYGIVTFSKSIQEGSPFHTEYDVDIVEVPGKTSKIDGESTLVVPDIKKISLSKSKTKSKTNDAASKKLNTLLSKCNVPYRKGQKNRCVKILQEKLISLGYLDKRYKTGVYDSRTVNAVKAFQRSTDGALLVDGVFGKYTRSYLLKK